MRWVLKKVPFCYTKKRATHGPLRWGAGALLGAPRSLPLRAPHPASLFSWPVYKAVLLLYRPLVSQPAVVAAVEGGRATDITDLRIGRTCPTLPRWREVCQSEVQTPILATSIWPAIRARLETHDNRSNWNIDLFWSLLAMLRRRCVAGARDLCLSSTLLR